MANHNQIYSEIINQPHYIVYADGQTVEMEHRVKSRLGNIGDLAQRVAASAPLTLNNIAEIGGSPMTVTMKRNSGQAHRIHYATTTQLKKLKFSTSFEVIQLPCGEKWLSPTFNSSHGDTATHFTLEWKVPDGLKLFITFHICEYLNDGRGIHTDGRGVIQEGTHNAYEIMNCYLHCSVDASEDNMWWILPTGNVYDNSKVCFGESFDNSPHDLVSLTKANIDRFYSTPWNADLLENRRGRAVNLFRFNADTNEQLEAKGSYKELLMNFVNNDLASYNINP